MFFLTVCVKSFSWDGGAVVVLLPGLWRAGSGPASLVIPTGTGNLFWGGADLNYPNKIHGLC